MTLRAVNLGGWFVLERWMKRQLFDQTKKGCNDETCFSEQTPNFHERLEEHYKTWITREDIQWLKQAGVNLVRIPIPWWLFGDGVYHRSVEAIDTALDMITDVGLDFMLDLHTAPGCQNGFDNGGIQYVIDWPKDPKYIEQTIVVLEQIMSRYNNNPHFHSIQLLNEPHVSIDLKLLKRFYKDAYQRLRRIHPTRYIVMHDGFRLTKWRAFFTRNHFANVLFDTHMYQCFDESVFPFSIEEHCVYAMKRKQTLAKLEEFVPVIVGEWSLGLRMNNKLKQDDNDSNLAKYAKAQLEAMADCAGHVFWSYKVHEEYSGWNFRALVDRGVINLEDYTK